MVNRTEKLLNPNEAAVKLGISRPSFYKLKTKLIAKGMKKVRVGKSDKYLESSLDVLIRKSAEAEKPLC